MNSLKTRFIVFFGAFILISCGLISIIAAMTIRQTGIVLPSEQGFYVAEQAVSAIDGDAFERFTKNPSESDPFYEKTRLALLNIKRIANCEYLYTMVQLGGSNFRYMIDGSCDPSDTENFSPLGTDEDISSYGQPPLLTMRDGITTTSGFTNQEGWGWMVSTYAPIKNSSGRVVGMLGVDFDVSSIMNVIRSRVLITSLVGFLFFVLGLILLFWFTGQIFGSMKVISNEMEKISKGKADLTSRLPEKGNNEISLLAKNCNAVIKSLANLVASLQGETDVLSESGTSLTDRMERHMTELNKAASNVDDIAIRVEEQTSRIESIADGMHNVEDEITGLDEKIAKQSGAIMQSSSAVEEISANIRSVEHNVSLIIDEYKNLVVEAGNGRQKQDKVSEQIGHIAEQSENLTDANDAIKHIAEQTNLLAMNAAIEAAHAGDFGKGFGVVADEIRALAETSAQQSASIQELLAGISEAIKEIVDSSMLSAASFDSVGSKISQLDNLIKQVQSGMSEEREGVDDILRTMKTLDGTTRDINDASKHMKSESANVFTRIKELQSLATDTKQKSSEVTSGMQEMKSSAIDASSASDRSKAAAQKVSDMIKGFKV